jgi:hypothetical protein
VNPDVPPQGGGNIQYIGVLSPTHEDDEQVIPFSSKSPIPTRACTGVHFHSKMYSRHTH